MSDSIKAFGAFGEVSIPLSRIRHGVIQNDSGKLTFDGEIIGEYKVPSGALDYNVELFEIAEQRGHKVKGFITALNHGTFYVI